MCMHLSMAAQGRIRGGFGRDIFRKHRILMPRYLPNINPTNTGTPRWAREEAREYFSGTVFTNGSRKRCKHYKPGDRAAYAAHSKASLFIPAIIIAVLGDS